MDWLPQSGAEAYCEKALMEEGADSTYPTLGVRRPRR